MPASPSNAALPASGAEVRSRHTAVRVSAQLPLLLAAILVASLSAPRPHAAERPATATVTYADLDISTPEGWRRLGQRVRSAAEEVCERARMDRRARDACVAAAVEDAMRRAGAQRSSSGIAIQVRSIADPPRRKPVG